MVTGQMQHLHAHDAAARAGCCLSCEGLPLQTLEVQGLDAFQRAAMQAHRVTTMVNHGAVQPLVGA